MALGCGGSTEGAAPSWGKGGKAEDILGTKNAKVVSKYTSLEYAACTEIPLPSTEFPDLFRAECPALPGYKVFFEAGDARSWLEIHQGEDIYDLSYDITTKYAIGAFQGLKGTPLEWRGLETASGFWPYALIFRVEATDIMAEPPELIEALLVAKLGDSSACVIGEAQTNAEAQALADARAQSAICE